MAQSKPTQQQHSTRQATDWPLWAPTQTSCSLCGTGAPDVLCCAARPSLKRCTVSHSVLMQMVLWSLQVSCHTQRMNHGQHAAVGCFHKVCWLHDTVCKASVQHVCAEPRSSHPEIHACNMAAAFGGSPCHSMLGYFQGT